MARKDYNIHSIPTKEVYYTELSTLDSFCNIKRNCNKTGRWRTTMGSVRRFSNGRKISDGVGKLSQGTSLKLAKQW